MQQQLCSVIDRIFSGEYTIYGSVPSSNIHVYDYTVYPLLQQRKHNKPAYSYICTPPLLSKHTCARGLNIPRNLVNADGLLHRQYVLVSRSQTFVTGRLSSVRRIYCDYLWPLKHLQSLITTHHSQVSLIAIVAPSADSETDSH